MASYADLKSVIAVKKQRQMSNPSLGKLHPLFYIDGSLIQDLYREFPNAGEIFVINGFETLTEDLLEVKYDEHNSPMSYSLVTEDSPTYSRYSVRPKENRYAVLPTERFADIVEWEAFPEFNSELPLPYKVTKYFFVESRETREIRGPYRVQEAKQVDDHYWLTKVMPAYPTDQICKHLPGLKDQLLVQFTPQELAPDAIIPLEGLFQFDLNYDERTLVNLSAVYAMVQESEDSHIVDAMSEADLLDWGRRTLAETPSFDKSEARKFRDMVLAIRQQDAGLAIPTEFLQRRFDRLLATLDKTSAVQSLISGAELTVLERYANTSEGKAFLDRYVNERRSDLMETIRRQVVSAEQKRMEEMREDVQKDVTRLRQEKDQLSKQVEELEKRSSQERLDALNAQHRTIQDQVAKLQEEVRYHERRIEDLKQQDKNLTQNLRADEEELRSRLAEQKVILDALSGYGAEKDGRRFASFVLPVPKRDHLAKQQCVDQAHQFLLAHGRNVTLAETSNYLASVVQNRFTVFAGYPGVGKTSLVVLLGRALGLRPNEDPRRLLKINVGRGWVSSRDLVGVYNPISKDFTPADSGLFHALKQVDDECRNGGPKLPLWVLLDEMNLSSVEHYLSDFIAQGDDNVGEVTFGRTPMRFDHALRFIGTVNYDETTEPLSPRMLSRSNVIYLAPPKAKQIDDSSDLEVTKAPEPITLEELRPFWNATPEFADDVDEEVKFRELAGMMEQEFDEGKRLGRPIVMDSRAILAIKRYCNATRDLISPERGKYGSLDFAFAQRVLPRVRGSGADYGRRLQKLREICDTTGMIESSAALKRIIEHGQEHDEYDFFAF